MKSLSRDQMVAAVERYFEACNAADRRLFAEVLSEDCRHYFPANAGGPYLGRDAIADLWIGFVRSHGSRWTIDRMVCDGHHVVTEWSHFKPVVAELIRGSEWYLFDDDGKICDIWAHYAAPRDRARSDNVLEAFPYRELGYAMTPPVLPAAALRSREEATLGVPARVDEKGG